MSLSCFLCCGFVCVVYLRLTRRFCCATKEKVGKSPVSDIGLRCGSLYFPPISNFSYAVREVHYYAGWVFLSHMHVGTETKPANLSPGQSSVQSHCFEVTTHLLWVELRGSGPRERGGKVNGISNSSPSDNIRCYFPDCLFVDRMGTERLFLQLATRWLSLVNKEVR